MKKVSTKILFLIVLCMGIGFSYLTSGLIIRGNTQVSGNSWNIYFTNIQVSSGSVEASVAPQISGSSTTSLNYTVQLEAPGDFYEFTVDVVNNGTMDAMIDSIVLPDVNLEYFDCSVTYLNGTPLQKEDLLMAKSTDTYKVRIEFLDVNYIFDEVEEGEEEYVSVSSTFGVNYSVADDSINRITYGQVWDFNYSGSENIFNVPFDGEYQIEVWGAQGGTDPAGGRGGYGGYARGVITLDEGQSLYLNVGGKGCGTGSGYCAGGYNGGGSGQFSGGGATHIATQSGLLSTLSGNRDSILIVAGGGAGNDTADIGGNGGGFQGTASSRNTGKGGTQEAGGNGLQNGSFGKGGNNNNAGGGGGGFYGGGGSTNSGDYGGGGGSGYIGNSTLKDKVMYCYSCTSSSEESTKTISTTNVSSSAISNYAKSGTGYARITYLGNANIFLTDFKKSTGSVNVNNITLNSKTGKISFETSLSNTTDYAEFSFNINNASDKNFYISKILKSNYDSTKMEYEITYEDGEQVSVRDYISSNNIEKIIVKIKLLDNSIQLNNEKITLTINLSEAKENTTYNRTFWLYPYEGKEEAFTIPNSGKYKLEVWGAQGGYGSSTTYRGGYGGYSTGYIDLEKNTILYINVGGKGVNGTTNTTAKKDGGYNGGGSSAGTTGKYVGSGGGATHIALESGLLTTFQSKQDKLLIVAGGGGSGGYESSSYSSTGGNGGGYQGTASSCNNSTYTTGKGGNQSTGGTGVLTASFGQGGNGTSDAMGGGGGFYGGGAGQYTSGGGGGSGYIGNIYLQNKAMYCYSCATSDAESTKTISTTNVSETPISQYAKIGNGYAKITYLGN